MIAALFVTGTIPSESVVAGQDLVGHVCRPGDVDLEDLLAADRTRAGRVVDADPSIVALENQELRVVDGDDGGDTDVAALPGIGRRRIARQWWR